MYIRHETICQLPKILSQNYFKVDKYEGLCETIDVSDIERNKKFHS